jgi:hypothetical protein
MSQAVLNQFYIDVKFQNKDFNEKNSSLKGLRDGLKRQIVKTSTANPAPRTLVPPVLPPSRPPIPPRMVQNKYDGDPTSLINEKWSAMEPFGGYTSLDTSRFGGSADAANKERAFPADKAQAYKQASQSAAGKKKLQQSTVKAIYDTTIEDNAGVGTTFAFPVAHVLTGGARQSGKGPVEVLGCDRGAGTHMYAVAGRSEASTPADPKSWGLNALIVDGWGTATYGNSMVPSVPKVASGDTKFADMYFRKIGQFYGNATPNPTEEDNKAHVEVQSIERTLHLQKAQMSQQVASQNQQSELAQVFKKRGVGGQNT